MKKPIIILNKVNSPLKEKDEVRLLKLLLKQVEKSFSYFPFIGSDSGICHEIFTLHLKGLTTFEEHDKLEDIIYYNSLGDRFRFWWPKGRKYPRIKFLKKLIKKYNQ
jgi:hypothetical protein